MSNYGNYKASPEFLMAVIAKHQQIINTVVDSASHTINLVKQLPKDGKHNPFIKKYNRRPGNKQKRALVMAQMVIAARMAEAQVKMIQASPIPKFKHGAAYESYAVVGDIGKEIIK